MIYSKRVLANTTRIALLTLLLILLGGCGSSSDENPPIFPGDIESRMTSILDAVNTDSDFTLLVTANDGTEYIHQRGASTETTLYRSASTSKLVTATVILSLVEQGILSLDDHPQDYLDFWPTTGNHAAIELRHLLSFTSGLSVAPACLSLPNTDFTDCVETILSSNPTVPVPGTEYYYSGSHLQVAGLMAIRASGKNDWSAVFAAFKTETQLFPDSSYDLPSPENPRLAGGMHWHARDYLTFLNALYHQQLLSATLLQAMNSDQVGTANIVYSPIRDGAIGLDWHYGFGQWIECPNIPFDCTATSRVSSSGAYGAYPFIDYEHQYYGIVAREGVLGTGEAGYLVWSEVEEELAEWAGDHR